VDCSSCHTSVIEKGTGSLDGIKQMCVECHESGYEEMLDGWQEMIRDEIKDAEKLLNDVAALLKAPDDKPQKQEASSLYNEARERVLFVQKDGSLGAHNVELADQLLTDAIDKLKKSQRLLK
jgi:formate-dependent nitrite reductase cytochrome c552 subunit